MATIKPEQLASGQYSISGSFSGSFFGNGSNLTNLPVPQIETGSFVTTSSFNAFTGSYNTGSFTGSFTGDGSGLTGIVSSSYAETASYAVSASYEINYETSSSYAETASVAISASYAETASFVQNAQTASYVLNAVSSSYALSASFAPSTPAFPFTGSALITGSLGVTGSASILAFTGSSATIFNVRNSANTANLFSVNGNKSFNLADSIYSDGFTTYLASTTGVLQIQASGNGLNLTSNFSSQLNATNTVSLQTNSQTRLNIDSTGNIGIGTTSQAARLDVRAQGALSTDVAFRVRNSADSNNILTVLGTQDVFIGTSTTPAGQGHLFNIRNGLGTSIPFAYFDNASFNLDIDRFCNIKLGFGTVGVTGATHTLTLGTGSIPTGRNFGQTMAAWTAISQGTNDSGFAQTGGDTSGNNAVYTNYIGKNWTLGGIIQGNGKNVLTLITGSSPTNNISSAFQLYASTGSITSNTRPHFRTENGTVVWLGDESRLFNVTASRTIISSSQNTISGSSLTVFGSGSAQPVFTVQGSQGELFSITDSLSGSLFSVNDISGLPILEVFSDSTTLIGDYLDPMLITTKKITMTNSGSFVVYSLPTSSYDAAFYDYSIRSGSNARAGQIMAIQSGSSVNFTETTTTDFGDTTAVSFTVIVSGSNMVLTGSAATGSWTTKCIIRGL